MVISGLNQINILYKKGRLILKKEHRCKIVYMYNLILNKD